MRSVRAWRRPAERRRLRASLATIVSSHGRSGAPSRKRPSARHAFTKPSCAASSASAGFWVISKAVRKAMSWWARTSAAYASASPAWARARSSPSVSARATTPSYNRGGGLVPVESVPEAIAGAAHRLELRDAERAVDLVAQVADVDVDDVRAVLVVVVPGVLEQLVAREDLAGVAHERLQELELLGRQVYLAVAPPDPAGGGVELQVADLEHRRALDRAATGEGAQARQQLGERERLGEIVVRAGVETRHAVLDRVARGQHDHRGPDPFLTQPLARLEAVDARQHHVQDDRVVPGGVRHPQSVLALDGHIGSKPLRAQPAPDEACHLDLVLDHKHSHMHHPHRLR